MTQALFLLRLPLIFSVNYQHGPLCRCTTVYYVLQATVGKGVLQFCSLLVFHRLCLKI